MTLLTNVELTGDEIDFRCSRHGGFLNRGSFRDDRRLRIEDGRIGARNRFSEFGVELHDLLVLRSPDVSSVGVVSGTRYVAEFAAQRVSRAARRWLLRYLQRCLLLLVLLALQVFAVRLRPGAADLTDIAVVKLLRLRRLLRAHRLHSSATGPETFPSVALPTSSLLVSRIAVCTLLGYIHSRSAIKRCVVAGIRCTRRF